MLININKIFENTIVEENIDTLEKILSASDNRMDLIEEFSKKNDLLILKTITLKFRSKGLITDIQRCCDLIINKKLSSKDKEKKFKSFKTKCTHIENAQKNKINYLQEDTFEKNKIKNKSNDEKKDINTGYSNLVQFTG